MNVDLIGIVGLIGGLIVLVKAILEVANVRSQIQAKNDRTEEKLDRKIDRTYERVKDELDRIGREFDLYRQLQDAKQAQERSELEYRFEEILERSRNLKKDLWDVQHFLQNKHDFKIRFNSPTLGDRDSKEVNRYDDD